MPDSDISAIINRLGLGRYAIVSSDDVEVTIEKNDRGTYNIQTVSTAAIEDREGETFTVEAIDYDIAEAKKHGDYPEFRVFHSKHLGIGRVKSMKRVGIFAVDEGESYDDPFSLSVCEKMLANNSGKWRVSRGFRVKELSGACPVCSKSLLVSTKHMVAGFKCSGCSSVHIRFKGVLGGIRFKKARTFDVTVTDVPAVPYTGALAWRDNIDIGGISMTKEELKERLLEAGIPEDAIDGRLKELTDEQLKEFDDIPMAEILKEFEDGDDEDGDSDLDDAVIVEFEDMVANFKEVVREVVDEALEGFQVEVGGLEDLAVEMKEVPGLAELKEQVTSLEEKLDLLLESDEDRIKQLLADTPRSGRVRILKSGKKKKPAFLEDDEEDEDEDEEDEEEMKEKVAPWIKSLMPVEEEEGDQIVDSAGQEYSSMTAMIHGNAQED